jgi:hypothetical protein
MLEEVARKRADAERERQESMRRRTHEAHTPPAAPRTKRP